MPGFARRERCSSHTGRQAEHVKENLLQVKKHRGRCQVRGIRDRGFLDAVSATKRRSLVEANLQTDWFHFKDTTDEKPL